MRRCTKITVSSLVCLFAFFVLTQSARAQTQTIDFEGLAPGAQIGQVFADGGFGPMEVAGFKQGVQASIIYDSSCGESNNPRNCSGRDFDLGTPNETFGGPGRGAGGMAGSEFENSVAMGNVLIVHENLSELDQDPVLDPDDTTGPNEVFITFPEPVTVFSYKVIDQETVEFNDLELIGEGGVSLGFFTTATTGDNGVAVMLTDSNGPGSGTEGVVEMVYTRNGSGGLDDIVIAPAEPQVGSIGDFVWCDDDDDGVQDADEPGIEGVKVNLTIVATGEILMATTDADGMYLFEDLPEGDYTVEVDPATAPEDKVPGNNCPAFYDVALGAGENFLDADFCYIPLGSIGDFVWNDENMDGIQDPGETGVEGVTATLTDCDGNFIADTMTDADGMYLFDELEAGCYKVTFSDIPADFEFSPQDQGGDDGLDSDADPTTGMSPEIDLGVGEDDLTIDAGIFMSAPEPGSIGDLVWCDNNNDGIFDSGEPGIAGVDVTLDCALAEGGTLVEVASTDADGGYLFEDIPADADCVVTVDEASSALADKVIGKCPPTVDHVVVAGEAFLDADFCFVNCAECDGGVTELSLQWTGDQTAHIVVEAGNTTPFEGDVAPGEVFSFSGTKDDGKFEKNDLEMFVDGVLQIKIHVSCSKAIGPGLPFGDFLVTAAVSRDGGPVCPLVCDECKGGVTNLTLKYNGTTGAQIVVQDDDATYFDGFVDAGAEFTFHGTKDDGKFEKNDLEVLVDGVVNTEIHVSCSQDINPGLDFGDFTVTAAFSKDNGPVCPVEDGGDPTCGECDGGVTSLTLQYDGAVGAQIRVEDSDEVYFDDFVAAGGEFTIDGTKDDGKFQKNELDLFVDDALNAEIHVSCSQDIGVGFVYGDFTVLAGASRDGGPFCDPNASVSFATQDRPTVFELVPAVTEFVVEAPYPNPFNPATTIRFGLPENSHVKMVVYDILGRQVQVLVDDEYRSGMHRVEFVADGLPSGTYLYRLESQFGTKSGQLVLLR